jgi:hypothetical protein
VSINSGCQEIVHSIAWCRLTDSGSGKGGHLKPRPAGRLIRPVRQEAKVDTRPSSKCGALHLVQHHFAATKFSTLSRLARVSSVASQGTRDRAIRPSRRWGLYAMWRSTAEQAYLLFDQRVQEVLGPVRESSASLLSKRIRALEHALVV